MVDNGMMDWCVNGGSGDSQTLIWCQKWDLHSLPSQDPWSRAQSLFLELSPLTWVTPNFFFISYTSRLFTLSSGTGNWDSIEVLNRFCNALSQNVLWSISFWYRCVTNFVSAHDCNTSLTVDIYFNEKNEEIDFDPNNPSGDKDSIWNFHVSLKY